jgi:hypothetical protein
VPEIQSGQLVLFYLFDVAETVDLQAVPQLVGGPAVAAKLAPKSAIPAYVQYDKPPLSFDGDTVGIADVAGFRPRFRAYDYGVISVALTQPFKGSWREFVASGQLLVESADFESHAEQLCRTVTDRLRPALKGVRPTTLTEDYVVFVVHELEAATSAEVLLETRGQDIAQMLRGEAQPLSAQETAKILSHRISYLADDLVVATWNAAFVYDTPTGSIAALEIIEFANSQLLEFRYYDSRLDAELASIYSEVQKPRWFDRWLSSRATKAARQVHALFIDVNELTDRTENTLKFIGDIYTARLFLLVAERFGLATWKADVEAKLKTLDDIYRFAVEQSSMARGEFLELTIVLILVLELVLLLLGVMT